MRLPQLCLTAATATAIASLLSMPSQAATMFGTDGIKFDADTNVDFTFQGSNGAYQSVLKIFEGGANVGTAVKDLFAETKASDNGGADGWLGTCGNTVLNCTNSFNFKAGVEYTLGLVSTSWGQSVPTVYSTNSLNTNSGKSQQAVFGTFAPSAPDGTKFDATPYQKANPFAGVVKIAFDDRGNGNDVDFNDFRVTAVAKSVPEPATLAGLGMMVGILAISRRRKVGQISHD